MNHKEKAKELLDKYIKLYPSYIVMCTGDIVEAEKNITECVLIAVDEILKELDTVYQYQQINYWKEVKTEIENL